MIGRRCIPMPRRSRRCSGAYPASTPAPRDLERSITMEFAYRPELWRDLFDMVALAAVTLTGLLSVGLSINSRRIVDTPAHVARAREALIALTLLLTVSIFVLIPEQGLSLI